MTALSWENPATIFGGPPSALYPRYKTLDNCVGGGVYNESHRVKSQQQIVAPAHVPKSYPQEDGMKNPFAPLFRSVVKLLGAFLHSPSRDCQSRAREQAVSMISPPEQAVKMPSSLENPPALSREQFHQMLAEALADPQMARRILRPLLANAFPITGGACGSGQSADKLVKFTSDCALVDSVVKELSGNIGIGLGTLNPGARLTVNGVSQLANDLDVTRRFDSFSEASIVLDNVITTGLAFQKLGGGNMNTIKFLANILFASGKVGIGTPTPAATLHVRADEIILEGLNPNGASTPIISFKEVGRSQFWIVDKRGSAWPGEPDQLIFGYFNGTDWKQPLNLQTNGNAQFNGNVGIGTTSPAEKLDVNGNILSQGLNKIVFLKPLGGGQDDQPQIQAAINALASTGGIIYLTPGTYRIGSPITILNSGIKLRGYGGTRPDGGYVNALSVTRLLWTPNSIGTILQLNSAPPATPEPILDLELSDLTIDGAGTDGAGWATTGLQLNRVVYSKFRNVHVENLKGTGSVGIKLTTTALASASLRIGSAWNLFEQCSVIKASQGVVLMKESGAANDTNSTHNTFVALNIEFHGTQSTDAGIRLGDCDNNSFHQTWILRRETQSPKGAGVLVEDPTEARSNYFYHLQTVNDGADASARGFKVEKADSPATNKNLIFGYDLENQQGQPIATKTDGSPASPSDFLFWIDSQGKIRGGQLL